MNKRIIIVIEQVSHLQLLHPFLLSLLHSFNVQVTIVALQEDELSQNWHQDNIDIIILPLLSEWHSVSLVIKLKQLYQTLRPFCVLHYGYYLSTVGGFAAHKLVESIAVLHDLNETFWKQKKIGASFFFKKGCQYNSELWVFNKQDRQDLSEKKGLYVPIVRVLPPGQSIDSSSSLIRCLKPDQACRVIMLAMHDGPCSGVSDYSRIQEELKKKYGNFVTFHSILLKKSGHISTDTSIRSIDPMLLWQSHILVCPHYRESYPILLAYGALAELPVIAANSGGNPEWVVDGQTGYLYDPCQKEGLKHALEKGIRCDPFKRRQMGRQMKERSLSHFDPENIKSIYRTLLQNWIKRANV